MSRAWRRVELGDATISDDSKRRPVKSSDRVSGPYPYWGASGVVDHVDGYLFDYPTLLVSEDGENLRTRKTPIAFLASGKYWVNNHAHVLRAKPDFDLRFLAYAVEQSDVSGFITGSTQPKLTARNLSKLPIWCPPHAEQRRIAGCLGALDDLIETNQRLVRGLETLSQSLFVRLMAETPINATVPLSSTVDILSGGTPRTSVSSYWGGSIPWYSVVDAPEEHQVWVFKTSKSITDEGLASSPSRLIPVGATILSARGTVGKVALVATPMAMNQSCYALHSHHGRRGFYSFFLVRSVVDELRRNAHGSVFDTVTRATLDGVMVPDLPPQIIERLENDIEPYLDQMLALLRENSELVRVRDELLPLLLSGRVLVREVAA